VEPLIFTQPHWEALTPNTQSAFHELKAQAFIQNFYLVGGTGLALHLGHRFSEQIRLLQSLKRPLVPVADNDEAGRMAISAWQEAVPWLEAPLRLPEQVDGVEIKDPNDLAAKLPEGMGQKIFRDLCKRRKIKL
jgi:hypothetical protein